MSLQACVLSDTTHLSDALRLAGYEARHVRPSPICAGDLLAALVDCRNKTNENTTPIALFLDTNKLEGGSAELIAQHAGTLNLILMVHEGSDNDKLSLEVEFRQVTFPKNTEIEMILDILWGHMLLAHLRHERPVIQPLLEAQLAVETPITESTSQVSASALAPTQIPSRPSISEVEQLPVNNSDTSIDAELSLPEGALPVGTPLPMVENQATPQIQEVEPLPTPTLSDEPPPIPQSEFPPPPPPSTSSSYSALNNTSQSDQTTSSPLVPPQTAEAALETLKQNSSKTTHQTSNSIEENNSSAISEHFRNDDVNHRALSNISDTTDIAEFPLTQNPHVITPTLPPTTSDVLNSDLRAHPGMPSRPHTGAHGRVIAVSGAKGGVGKSTTTLWIAEAFAATGLSVCVIDANIGQPDLAKMVGVWSMESGFDSLISHRTFTVENLKDVLTPVEGLGYLLPGPSQPIVIDKLQAMQTLKDAIIQLQTLFPVVLIDCPVASSKEDIMTHLILERNFINDLILVVAPHGITEWDAAAYIQEITSSDHAGSGYGPQFPNELITIILNQADPERQTTNEVEKLLGGRPIAGIIPVSKTVSKDSDNQIWQAPPDLLIPIRNFMSVTFGIDVTNKTEKEEKKGGFLARRRRKKQEQESNFNIGDLSSISQQR